MLRPRSSLIAVLLLFLAAGAFAQTTGGIIGKVTDPSGAALPGVGVEARSTSMQGVRTDTTEADGAFRFALLPPGDYEIHFDLSGFRPEARRITVSLGKDATLDVTMRLSSVTEELTVTAEAPVVDTTSAAAGTNFSTRAIETLPTGRNYAAIAQVAPGVTTDANPSNPGQSTIAIYGSSGAENSFVVDGVNTTNMEYGFQGKELNSEFIQEVGVKTGGYEAEFGRATGGIINVITKSGGNQFKGDVFGYHDSDSLQANAKSVVSTSGTQEGYTREDYGVDFGGYLMPDKLWFFAAYDRVNNSVDSALPSGPREGDIVPSKSRRNLASGKLTYNLAPSHSLVLTYLQDPRVDSGAINDANHTLNGEESTYLGRQDFGGRDYALRYDGAFASHWVTTVQAARHQEANSVGPATSAGSAVQYRDAANDFFQRGGFGLIQKKDFDRKHYGGSLLRLLGAHEVKGGIEYETAQAEVMKEMSGGQQVDVIANPGNASKPIYRHFYWTTPDATVDNAPLSALVASPEHKVTSAYVQDRWTINDKLVVSAGLRWDRQQIIDASGVTQVDLDKDYAPRLGFIFDPSGEHREKVYGSYGRYYEEIPMDLVIRSFSYERQPRIFNFDPTSTKPDPAAEAALGSDTHSGILGGFTEPSDPDMRNQYINEYLLGYEREIMPSLAIGVKGIYRNYGEVIEDFLCDPVEGTYCIGNPGRGLMKQIYALDYETLFNAPKPKRTFKGVQFEANKRFSQNWEAMASYLYSKLDGNYDGEYAPFTNVGADPNISAAYDYFDFFTDGHNLDRITNKGPLSNDRRHQFKASGMWQTPLNLTVGLSAYWRSGTPLTRYGYSDAYGRYEFFLTERGAEGRAPSNYDADLHLGYPVKLHGTTVNFLLDIFNVLNTQRAVLLDQRWGFQESDNQSPTPVNPGYGKPVLRTPPTSARIGVRISF